MSFGKSILWSFYNLQSLTERFKRSVYWCRWFLLNLKRNIYCHFAVKSNYFPCIFLNSIKHNSSVYTSSIKSKIATNLRAVYIFDFKRFLRYISKDKWQKNLLFYFLWLTFFRELKFPRVIIVTKLRQLTEAGGELYELPNNKFIKSPKY